MSAKVFAYESSSRKGSSSSSVSSADSTPARRSSSLAAPFKAMGHAIAEHHRDVTAAYEAYYRIPNSRQGSVAETSQEDQKAPIQKERKSSKTWESIKKHAKEHNESVNNAYRLYYGIS